MLERQPFKLAISAKTTELMAEHASVDPLFVIVNDDHSELEIYLRVVGDVAGLQLGCRHMR